MKRGRCALDPSDEAFDDVLRVLEEKEWQSWSRAEKDKLVIMLQQYVAADDNAEHASVGVDAESTNFWRSMDAVGEFIRTTATPSQIAGEIHRPTDTVSDDEHRHDISRPLAQSGSCTSGGEVSPPPPTFAVDSFVCPGDDEIDDLCTRGLLSRNYCRQCGSTTSIGMTSFVSHSLSRTQLSFIYSVLFPMVVAPSFDPQSRGLTLVDVGSRLGAVLYAAWFATAAQKCDIHSAVSRVWVDRIIGIEIDESFVRLQRSVIQHFKMNQVKDAKKTTSVTRCVEVMHLDAVSTEGQQILRGADIVVLNNVFEWFVAPAEQLKIWVALRSAISVPGQLILAYPAIEDSILPLLATARKNSEAAKKESLSFLCGWVEAIDVSAAVSKFLSDGRRGGAGGDDSSLSADDNSLAEQISELCMYRVVGRKSGSVGGDAK